MAHRATLVSQDPLNYFLQPNDVGPYIRVSDVVLRVNLNPMDWYAETPHDIARHDPHDPEDTPGIAFLRHVRGMALDQVNGLYDVNAIFEMVALYAERVAKRHFAAIPEIAAAADKAANLFRKWDESDANASAVLRFICSGLVQYSFFSALRRRVINDLAVPEHRTAAMNNLNNM